MPTPQPTTPMPSPGPTFNPTVKMPSANPTPRPSPQPTTPQLSPAPTPMPTAVPSSVPTCVGPINVDLCLALDESGSVCFKPGRRSLCNGGTCDFVDPITGITTCTGPQDDNCDYVNGCPKFNTSREPSSRSAFTPSTGLRTQLTARFTQTRRNSRLGS